MLKNIITTLLIFVCFTGFWACDKQQSAEYPDICIGQENILELSLNKQMEKKLILSGGNGKYIVNVENSQIATAVISKDTLKVRGLLEGKTFATILSHDKKARLEIDITYPEVGVTHTVIQLRPSIMRKVMSVSGGGELANLIEDDPADVVDVKWEGSTGMLEINPKYEGEAKIIVVSENGTDKKVIDVKVRPEGELDAPGWYTTTSHSYYKVLNNQMVVARKGVGTWIMNSTRPYGEGTASYSGIHIKIAPIVNPIPKDSITIKILEYNKSYGQELKLGLHKLYVEEVRESEVLLRGRGFKFVLPYEK